MSFVTLTRIECGFTIAVMSTCPSCNQQIATPSMFNLQAWAEFVCPHCSARLEAKAPRSTPFAILMTFLFGLGRHGRIFEAIAVAFMIVFFAMFITEAMYPKLRLKKPLPEPAIRLNIFGNQE